MKKSMLTITACALTVAACGGPAAAPSANKAAPANEATANAAAPASGNASTATAAGPLSSYVGQTVFDEVDGVAFVNHPLVRGAVEAAVADAGVRRWVLRDDGVSSPIALRDGRLVATACERSNCGPHHWTILIDPAGASAEVCYAVNSTLERADWYVAGRPAESRPGDCPTTG